MCVWIFLQTVLVDHILYIMFEEEMFFDALQWIHALFSVESVR